MPQVDVATYLPERATSLFEAPRAVLESSGDNVPWDERPRVVVNISSDERLQTILTRAAGMLGVFAADEDAPWLVEHYNLAFYWRPDDQVAYLNVLLDQDGSATWIVKQAQVTHKEVAASVDAGLFRGDPNRIYLVLDETYAEGGNGFYFWHELTRTLPQTIIYIGALYGGARAFTDIAWATYKLILRAGKKWQEKGAKLADIRTMVSRPRTTEEAARLLGVSETEAETLLRALGLERASDGRWRTATDKDAEVLRLAIAISEEAADHVLAPSSLERCLEEIGSLPPDKRLKNVGPILRRVSEEDYPPYFDEEET